MDQVKFRIILSGGMVVVITANLLPDLYFMLGSILTALESAVLSIPYIAFTFV